MMSEQPKNPMPTVHEDFAPADEMIIDDLDTLKVLADPLRLRIRELMSQPCTVKQVAAELDIPATKLYYHINLLEKHDLIVLVDTRIVSGIIEKHYQVAARSIRVARHLLSPNSPHANTGFDVVMSGLFDDTRSDLSASLANGIVQMDEDSPIHRTLSAGSARFALTPAQAEDLYERLGAIVEEFNALSDAQMSAEDAPEDLQLYKYLLVVFPSSRKFRLRADDATEDDRA